MSAEPPLSENGERHIREILIRSGRQEGGSQAGS